ncbi:MAG TPA: hypothetical protein VFT70_08085 [Nocardioides sp.]|nr:hypothetical protein [Nocardioides sp.]
MRRITVPVVLAALALVSGCGSSDDPSPAPAPTATPGTAGASPSDAGSSPGDAAAGVRLTRPNSSVVAPEGWTRGRQVSRDADSADSPDQLSYIELAEIEAFGSTADAAELGRTRIASSIDAKPPKLLPVTELDGVPVYHVAGFVNDEQYLDEYGAIRNDRIVTLTFSFNRRVPADERDQVVAEVLPTFAWK